MTRPVDDYYVTPEWVTAAIVPHLPRGQVALDPCAGDGAILRVLVAAPYRTLVGFENNVRRASDASDVDPSLHILTVDALGAESWGAFDVCVMNPPFRHAHAFVARALVEALPQRATVAALLRLGFLASRKRAALHRAHPADVYVLSRRPAFTGTSRTDATEYAWFVWGPGRGGRWQGLDCPQGVKP